MESSVLFGGEFLATILLVIIFACGAGVMVRKCPQIGEVFLRRLSGVLMVAFAVFYLLYEEWVLAIHAVIYFISGTFIFASIIEDRRVPLSQIFLHKKR